MSRGRAAETVSPLCFTVFAKGSRSSQATHPKASLVSLCLGSWRDDTSRAVEGKSLAPSELPALHRVLCPLQLHSHAHLLHSQPLQEAQDQHLPPTHSAPGCHFPHFLPVLWAYVTYNCRSWWDLFRMEDLYFTGITSSPEMPKRTPWRDRKSSFLGLSMCFSFSWLVTVVPDPIP